jgi:hypothetical protein
MRYLSKSKLAVVCAVVFCLVVPMQNTYAWGPGGHMMVAKIAYKRLNPKAKAQIDKLIAIKIEPVSITSRSLDFVNAAHWPDDLRPEEAFAFSLPLHFVDIPFSSDGTTLPTDLPESQNIVTALKHYVAVLKSNANDNQRAQALRFIIHFVGDIHQPLHCATRVSHDNEEGDRGGNLVSVKIPGKNGRLQTVKLHSYWDGGIGDFPKAGANFAPPPLSQITPAVTKVLKENPDTDPGWKAGGAFDFQAWADESDALAKSTAYNGITPNKAVSKSYNTAALKAARKRVAWGGYRLAELLNEIFANQ